MTDEKKVWLEVEAVSQQAARALAYVLDGTRAEYSRLLEVAFLWKSNNLYESPLEAIFIVWVLAVLQVNQGAYRDITVKSQQDVEAGGQRYRLDFVVIPTAHILPELLASAGLTWPLIGVEVDGHEFHEKTKEQVAYRNKRDRDLQAAGWKIFHYSWSEVVRDPASCVHEVLAYGRQAYWTLESALIKAGVTPPGY